MPKLGDVTFHGKSGQGYVFEVYPVDTDFNDVAAVYAVTRRYKDTRGGYSHEIIYVGETKDLSERFDEHHKANCFIRHNANCICTHLDDKEAPRLTKENDLIKKHNPPCND
jgi:excinuclease UvrABC nuclease subunit